MPRQSKELSQGLASAHHWLRSTMLEEQMESLSSFIMCLYASVSYSIPGARRNAYRLESHMSGLIARVLVCMQGLARLTS
jgi:hypothetical protein